MHYSSTNRRSSLVTFREAVLRGQPDDGGLYFPSEIPQFRTEDVDKLLGRSNAEIAFRVISPFVSGEIPDDELMRICSETIDLDIPLVEVSDRIWALELFHGPTMAFKDIGARFMSRCLRYFSQGTDQKTVVVVATSGDTGGAVAAGFHGVDGIDVVILFPKNGVSEVQELQLTRLGGNVTTLELHGTFDDCQRIAKQALADADLRSRCSLTSANSINVARWLPQQFYYYLALKQWAGSPPIVSVPSGNFGNLAAGMLAHRSGLPISRFIGACNANDVVPRFLRSGEYEPRPSIATLSNAMDVGSPSNFVRILELYVDQRGRLADDLSAVRVSDEQTAEVMRTVYEEHGYLLDPHGAVAYKALSDSLIQDDQSQGIFLGTAHPIKFGSVSTITGASIPEPASITELRVRKRVSREVENNYAQVRDAILDLV